MIVKIMKIKILLVSLTALTFVACQGGGEIKPTDSNRESEGATGLQSQLDKERGKVLELTGKLQTATTTISDLVVRLEAAQNAGSRAPIDTNEAKKNYLEQLWDVSKVALMFLGITTLAHLKKECGIVDDVGTAPPAPTAKCPCPVRSVLGDPCEA